jgi:hypothetical protein
MTEETTSIVASRSDRTRGSSVGRSLAIGGTTVGGPFERQKDAEQIVREARP